MDVFRATLRPDVAVLAAFRRSLAVWLEGARVDDPSRSDLVLATHEAAANAIEHAGCSGPIRVRAEIDGRTVAVEIRDYGRWSEPGLANEERGRGLALIEALVSTVEILRNQSGTTLRLVHARLEEALPAASHGTEAARGARGRGEQRVRSSAGT